MNRQHFNTPADERVKDWYTKYWGVRDPKSNAYDTALTERAGGIRGLEVLDEGCAYPWAELAMGPLAKRFVGVDFCENTVAEAKAELVRLGAPSHVDVVLADLRDLPFPDASFDVVLSFSTIDHVEFRRDLLNLEVRRVLRPGGVYVLSYPNRNYLGGIADVHDTFGFAHYFLPEEIQRDVEVCGFEVVHHETPAARSGLIARKR